MSFYAVPLCIFKLLLLKTLGIPCSQMKSWSTEGPLLLVFMPNTEVNWLDFPTKSCAQVMPPMSGVELNKVSLAKVSASLK